MKRTLIPAVTLLALAGAAVAQNSPPGGGDRQMPSVEERYKMLDANGDGKVSLDEFKAMRGMGMRGGQGGPPPGGPAAGGPQGGNAQGGGPRDMSAMREERFKAIDANKDGNLSLDEYKAAPMGPRGGMGRGGDQKRGGQ